MSDKDLIAEARAAMDFSDDTGWFWVGRLCNALEQAEARIAEAAKLHQPEPFHDEPTESFCKTCQRTSGVWPCGTAIALGLNEGEHDD